MTTGRKRLSLTKTDIQTTAGLELLRVLQSIADDGQVNEEEVLGLRNWLDTNNAVALPSHQYLTDLINDVVRDGIITEDEFKVLHDAVLRVLPPELRSIADLRRRERRKQLRDEHQQQQHEETLRKRDERERNRPLERADFMIAGATIGEDRREACEGCCEDDPVSLDREPDNPHDSNAIQVIAADGALLGYVPRDVARDLAPLLDAGGRQDFKVKKLLGTSSNRIIPVIVGAVYRADAQPVPPSPMPLPALDQSTGHVPAKVNTVRATASKATYQVANRVSAHSPNTLVNTRSSWTIGEITVWIVCAAAIGLLGLVIFIALRE